MRVFIWSSLSASALVVLMTGCASLSETPLNTAPHAMSARPAAQVEMFSSGPPTRPHVDVMVYEATSGTDEPDSGSLISRMRDHAGEQGCDGLVISQVNNQSGRDGHTIVTGTCIVYTAPEAPPAAPPPPPVAPTAAAPLPPPPAP